MGLMMALPDGTTILLKSENIQRLSAPLPGHLAIGARYPWMAVWKLLIARNWKRRNQNKFIVLVSDVCM